VKDDEVVSIDQPANLRIGRASRNRIDAEHAWYRP
jgi:hypothetical protein